MTLRICWHLPMWLLYIAHCVNSEIPEDWVDPHDMSPSADYLSFTDGQLPFNDYYKERNKGSSNCICDLSDKKSEVFLKRTINLLLNAVHEDNSNEYMYSGHLFFKIDAKNVEILRNFANGFDKNVDLIKIDTILSELLTKPTDKHVQEFLESYFHKFLNVLLTKEGIITVVGCSYLYLIYKMFLAKFYWRYVMKFLFFNVIIFDFVFTWVHLYKKAEIGKMTYRSRYKELPLECNPEKLDSWQFFWNVFSREDACRKYHEVKYQDIFWTISPGLVLSEMFSNLVEGPLLTLGGAFSGTCRQIYDSLPWGVNILLTPIALLLIILTICLIVSLIISTPFTVNFLNMLSIKFGSSHRPINMYCVRCHTILNHNRIIDAIPWPFNIIILPVALVFLCILVGIILAFIFRGNVKLNLFYHLFSFSISGHNPQTDYRVTNQRIEELPYSETRIIHEASIQTDPSNLQIKDTSQNKVRLGELSKCVPEHSSVETIPVEPDTMTDNEQVSDVTMHCQKSGVNVCNTKNRREISDAKGDHMSGDTRKLEHEPNLTTGGGDC